MYFSHIKAAATLIQDLNSGRTTLIKLVNGGKMLQTFQSVCSRFFTESSKENFEMMGPDFKEKLVAYIDPGQLPQEYGGTLPSLF